MTDRLIVIPATVVCEATTRCKTLCRQMKVIANHTEGQHIQPEGRRTLQ